jgi:hypothetical protein
VSLVSPLVLHGCTHLKLNSVHPRKLQGLLLFRVQKDEELLGTEPGSLDLAHTGLRLAGSVARGVDSARSSLLWTKSQPSAPQSCHGGGLEASTSPSPLSKGDDETKKNLKIVSVLGFGGLGKTTLVKTVYDKMKGDFNCTAFVPVGRSADAKKVFMDILPFIGMYQSHFTELDERQLIDELRNTLEYKRYVHLHVSHLMMATSYSTVAVQ